MSAINTYATEPMAELDKCETSADCHDGLYCYPASNECFPCSDLCTGRNPRLCEKMCGGKLALADFSNARPNSIDYAVLSIMLNFVVCSSRNLLARAQVKSTPSVL